MTDKTTAALKLAEEALNAMLTHMGMDEDEWTKPTFNQAREALAAIREARAEQDKQEPVAWMWVCVDVESRRIETGLLFNRGADDENIDWTPLYAAPVSAKREWVDLTDDELKAALEVHQVGLSVRIGRIAIAAFKEKNK